MTRKKLVLIDMSLVFYANDIYSQDDTTAPTLSNSTPEINANDVSSRLNEIIVI